MNRGESQAKDPRKRQQRQSNIERDANGKKQPLCKTHEQNREHKCKPKRPQQNSEEELSIIVVGHQKSERTVSKNHVLAPLQVMGCCERKHRLKSLRHFISRRRKRKLCETQKGKCCEEHPAHDP